MPLELPSEESLLQPFKNKIIEQHQMDLQKLLVQLAQENQLNKLWSQGECSTLDYVKQVFSIIDDRSARDAALRATDLACVTGHDVISLAGAHDATSREVTAPASERNAMSPN
ncbi:unnamed protein product [Lampetra planeri]